MFCPRCGVQNPDEAKFCGSCSAELPRQAQPVPAASPAVISHEKAEYAQRAIAFLIDGLVAFAISILVGLAVGVIALAADDGVAGLNAIVTVLSILAALAVFAPFWTRSQSPGKSVMNLKVVDRDGRPTSSGRMMLREVVLKGIVVGLLWWTIVGAVLWYLWPLWDRERRAPHDIIMGTHVVKAKES
jgi:uncharacterized RDD family membrane protein YckC